ncbi:DNA polymerase alpha/epsilon subunit B-domain-containing protein [Durotheca rogersii]|uniref:DNA polymerase alpha/epsilon subunit B-domain-containing protein n=1 Tax=Durotheca rogersii TaxID=419775 RepID=UPI00221F4D44|nr:DNA polymerase alpha/epsilon subunit B-domain-containing protein [Durotheca rogersii]KAI5860299.1 DNA polymerase alpha/epsilon subunit B-domain-containing protein [Durotheca rogersii]
MRTHKKPAASLFPPQIPALTNLIPSSSPAFGTPAHTPKPFAITPATKATILPILLPPATLRPLAFRTFTKKHSLTLTSSALQELATFIGRHCGSGWREEGLAEKVLEEVAKSWKNRNGGVIVDGASTELKDILKTLEGNMSGGRIVTARELSRQNSFALDSQDTDMANTRLGLKPTTSLSREDAATSFGVSRLGVEEEEMDDEELNHPRKWLKVISAYDQPRLLYNVTKKHFEKDPSKPSLMPPASHKTVLFRNRYNVIHQRLLRNEAFQSSAVASTKAPPSLKRSSSSNAAFQQTYKITPIANLLGRHGSHHMLLGLLAVLPTGTLAISDLTGTISLDLSHAVAIPEDSSWFAPGMIVLVDGVYEEEEESAGTGLGGSNGVGGIIGGRFQGFFVGQPPCEKRRATLGVGGPDGGPDHTIAGGFGWIDFLGVGSERAVGSRMRRLEQRILRRQLAPRRPRAAPPSQLPSSAPGDPVSTADADEDEDEDAAGPGPARVVVLGELNLDQPRALHALHKVLATYATEREGRTPMTFVLAGNFARHAVMAGGGGSGGSVEYKECFDALAAVLGDFPALLQAATFVFVPGDNDGWASAFGAGAAVPLPRRAVPDLFTSRVRRAFAAANAELAPAADKKRDKDHDRRRGGDAVWTTNPARLSVFGPVHEIVVFRDDLSARLRRTAVRLKPSAPADGDKSSSKGDDGDVAMADAAADTMEVDGSAAAAEAEAVPHDVRTARKLVKTVLDQGYLAPFRPAIRPVLWDHGAALHLYPLPTALVLVDPTAPPFCITYEGCHVMNPGALLVAGRRGVARWVEYEFGGVGTVRECLF